MVSMDKSKWDFQMKLGEGAACRPVAVDQVSFRILVEQNIWRTLVRTLFDLGSDVCRSLGFDYQPK